MLIKGTVKCRRIGLSGRKILFDSRFKETAWVGNEIEFKYLTNMFSRSQLEPLQLTKESYITPFYNLNLRTWCCDKSVSKFQKICQRPKQKIREIADDE